MTPFYLGLGSNQDEPAMQLQRAIEALRTLPDSRLTGVSSLYVSAPISPVRQPDFLNAAVRMETKLLPTALLSLLKGIEAHQGRERTSQRWGPRSLDIDLLLYGGLCIDTPELRLPHPELARRAFVLLPLNELEPALEIPGIGALAELLPQVRDQRIHKLNRTLSLAAASLPSQASLTEPG